MPRARFLIALSLFGPAATAQTPDAQGHAFDAYVTRAVKDWEAVGLAVAVVKDGRVVFARGYGLHRIDLQGSTLRRR
jgi:CubicO group peptidase (beta-lactamase class C family)